MTAAHPALDKEAGLGLRAHVAVGHTRDNDIACTTANLGHKLPIRYRIHHEIASLQSGCISKLLSRLDT